MFTIFELILKKFLTKKFYDKLYFDKFKFRKLYKLENLFIKKIRFRNNKFYENE